MTDDMLLHSAFLLAQKKKKTLKDNKILNHSVLKAMSTQEWKEIARGNTEFRNFFAIRNDCT